MRMSRFNAGMEPDVVDTSACVVLRRPNGCVAFARAGDGRGVHDDV